VEIHTTHGAMTRLRRHEWRLVM